MSEKIFYPEYSKHYPLLVKNCLKKPMMLFPNETAMVYRNDEGQYLRFTWREWLERTCKLAHAMKTLGVKEGDRIATMALNHHWHMENIYASICSGAISHPINMRLSLDHMTYTINHAEDKIIFFDADSLLTLEALYDRIKDKVELFVYMSDKPGLPETSIKPLYNYEELIKDEPSTYDWPDLDEDTHAVLYYTTGTTGLPKGVLYTNRQVYLQCIFFLLRRGAALRMPGDPPPPDDWIPMMNVPLFHIHAWGAPFYYVFEGVKIVFPGKFTAESFCELVHNEKVTQTSLVPTMLAMLVEYEDIGKWDLSSLIQVTIGGGALPLGLKLKAEKLFPTMNATSGYGMTETMAGCVGNILTREMREWPKEKVDQVLVKTGFPYIPGVEARVVDEDGNDVPRDNETIGEIVVRGHWIMEQYYKDPEKTAAVWRDGWLHTGDVAKMDELGYMTIADRITDVIRSGSEMVPTVLLENLTSNAEFVLEAAYVGVPDDKWGETPLALVRKTPDSSPSEEDILTFLQKEGVDTGKITRWMLPVYVAFVKDIPKTSVGKYDKIAIRKQLDEFMDVAKRVRKT